MGTAEFWCLRGCCDRIKDARVGQRNDVGYYLPYKLLRASKVDDGGQLIRPFIPPQSGRSAPCDAPSGRPWSSSLLRHSSASRTKVIWSTSPPAGKQAKKVYLLSGCRRVTRLIGPVCRAAGILTPPSSPTAITTADRLGEAGGPHGFGAGDRARCPAFRRRRDAAEAELVESVWAIENDLFI